MNAFPSGLEPMPVVEAVWKANQGIVDRFRLQFHRNGACVIGRSYFVPVTVGVPNPDVSALIKALDVLQDQVETQFGAHVTLSLDPSAANGTPVSKR